MSIFSPTPTVKWKRDDNSKIAINKSLSGKYMHTQTHTHMYRTVSVALQKFWFAFVQTRKGILGIALHWYSKGKQTQSKPKNIYKLFFLYQRANWTFHICRVIFMFYLPQTHTLTITFADADEEMMMILFVKVWILNYSIYICRFANLQNVFRHFFWSVLFSLFQF